MSEPDDTENALFLDLMTYGTAFYKYVDGRKVRVLHKDVYFKVRWWKRLWSWIRSQSRE